MLDFLEQVLRENSVALLFAVLGLGYLIGKTKIRGFELGSITGVLFVGLIFGNFGYQLNATVQSIGFALFIYSVGFQAGPSFFSVLRHDGLKYGLLAVVIAVTGFALALTFSKLLGLAPGASGGLLAGGMTSSPTLAAAQEAVRAGDVPVPEGMTPDEVMTNIAAAYAITYIFGLVGLIMIIRFLPRLLGVNLAREAAKLESERTGGVEDRAQGIQGIDVRAYRVTNQDLVGRALRELYEKYPGRMSVEKLRRNGELIAPTLDLEIELNDEVCFVGYLDEFIERAGNVGIEISDPELLDVALETCRIVPLRRKLKSVSTTIGDITANTGCFVSKIQRLGVDLSIAGEIRVQAGDVVHVTGPHMRVQAVGERVGHIERATSETDLATFMIGGTVGLLIGGLSVTIGGISVGLGTAGGLLAAGLVIGYLRAIFPTFGRLPEATRWVFMELGLTIFMAGVGLRAGAGILETLSNSGPSLFLAGIAVTTVPVAIGYLFGRKVLSINPVYLLGAITGSMTSGASLSIVTSEAKSSLPSLGYTGAYAFANVLLTVAGSVILLL